MKKILVIGASILQLPGIIKAKELGYEVGVVDYNPNAIGIKYADKFFNVSTIDKQGVYNVAKEYNPDGIFTLATDMPMRSIAYACSKLNLCSISIETSIICTDKAEMIKCFEKNNVSHPWFYIIKNVDELKNFIRKIEYPCIIKPTDNSGSRGVSKINSEDELLNMYSYAKDNSRSGNVIIEEFLEGKEVSVEVFTINSIPYVLQVTDKLTTGSPHFVELGHSQPSRLAENDIEEIKKLAIKAVESVGIKNGPAHVEIMLTSSGPKMIELGARMGGDCITSHLVPLSTGIDMIRATIESSCGILPNINKKFAKASAIRYITSPIGKIINILGVEVAKKIEGIVEISFFKNIGDLVTDIHSSSDRVGYVISQANTVEEAIKNCEKAIEKIIIEIEE